MANDDESRDAMAGRLRTPQVVWVSGGGIGVLPAGTMVRQTRNFSEGISRFELLINVEGGWPDVEPVSPQARLEPMSVFLAPELPRQGVSDRQVLELIRALGVSQSDLAVLAQELEPSLE